LIPPALLATPGTVNVSARNPGSAAASASDGISNSLQLTINPAPAITPIPLTGFVGVAFPATPIARAGGTLPFAWSLSPTNLGLFIDASGVLQGIPNQAGPFTLQISLRDAASVVATANFPLTVTKPAALTLNLQQIPVPPDKQGIVKVALDGTAPNDVTGDLKVSFQLDPAVAAQRDTSDLVSVFPTSFTISQGSLLSQEIRVIPGLAAGVLTITASNIQGNGIAGAPAPMAITIPPGPPAVTGACITNRGSSAFSVSVKGSSNTREITRARFQLTGKVTTELDQNNGNGLFGAYYSTQLTAFDYLQNFQVNGDPNDIAGVSVILENTQGASKSVVALPSCQ
jgi:hypothetical protein